MKHRKNVLLTIMLFGIANTIGLARSSAEDLLRESGIDGGIIAHIGCNDGQRTVELHSTDRLLVHGLDTDSGDVAKARAHIDSLGLYGQVSAESYDGENLPYGDNLVNLVLLEDAGELEAKEIARALAPNGVVLVKGDMPSLTGAGLKRKGKTEEWVHYVKPWPESIDEWTHFLYDASGNAVSKDRRVGHPRHLQWRAGPLRSRHHDALASLSAMTSSDGRLYYIFDEGPVSVMHQPANWKLIARDAFNGKLLWKRDIPTWMTHLYNFRAGPKQLPRRLVSIGDQVFVTLGLAAPISRLDGRTGITQLVYKGSENAEELVIHNGMLLMVKGDPNILVDKSDDAHGYWELAEYEEPTVDKSIIAFEAETGKRLWTVTGENLRHLTPLSLCAKDDKIFYLDNENLHCLDASNGEERWASPFRTEGLFLRSYAPTVVVYRDVIMCLTWNRLFGYSISDGKRLWENKGSIGFGAPGDLFGIGDKVWTNPMTKGIARENEHDEDGTVIKGIRIPTSHFLNEAKTGVGIDIRTGEIVEHVPFEREIHHHRCYRNKATERYILVGFRGIQLIDPQTKTFATNHWVRGICQYGIMPANGYIYAPPDPCRCHNNTKTNGFLALSERNSIDEFDPVPVLEPGPAYKRVSNRRDAGKTVDSDDGWPTYRGKISRAGSTKNELPDTLSRKWKTRIGPGITPPVVADASVYVAERNSYAVHCLNQANGERKWKFLANGPVDSPPTIHNGLCLFGCGDGSVYCLDAESGELVWRFKVSGIERRIGSEDRLESPLPVSGSVLILDGKVYFAAGHSSFLDGGIRLYALDVATGTIIHHRTLATGHWAQTSDPAIPEIEDVLQRSKGLAGALPDILVSDGATIQMRHVPLNPDLTNGQKANAIYASTGLLDDTWFNRLDWDFDGAKGQLLVYDKTTRYSVANPYTNLSRDRREDYKKYNQAGHKHIKFTRYKEEWFPIGSIITATIAGEEKSKWSIEEAFQPRPMTLAGKRLYLAGWRDSTTIEVKTGRAKSGDDAAPRDSVLRVYAAETGERLSEYALESEPVFDGAAAAYGDLFISLKNGELICMGKNE